MSRAPFYICHLLGHLHRLCHEVQATWTICEYRSLAMEIYHEWMSSIYINMPSITTTLSFFLHKPCDSGRGRGGDDSEGEIQFHFCKHHLPIQFFQFLLTYCVGRKAGLTGCMSCETNNFFFFKKKKSIKKPHAVSGV